MYVKSRKEQCTTAVQATCFVLGSVACLCAACSAECAPPFGVEHAGGFSQAGLVGAPRRLQYAASSGSWDISWLRLAALFGLAGGTRPLVWPCTVRRFSPQGSIFLCLAAEGTFPPKWGACPWCAIAARYCCTMKWIAVMKKSALRHPFGAPFLPEQPCRVEIKSGHGNLGMNSSKSDR